MASDYVVREKDGMYYVYNEVYEDTLGKIIAASLLGLLLPEASDYYLPICIKMKKTEGNIIVTKNLEVKGSLDFKYFIAKHQYQKWKKANRIIKSIIFMLGLLIDVFFIYLFWKSEFNAAMGLCTVGMLFLTIGAIVKLEWNNRKRMKYEMIDIHEKKEEL